MIVEDLRNEQPSFMVRVAVDHADRTYVAGDEIKVVMRSEKSGFLYLVYRDADGRISCLFPNKVQKENKVEGKAFVSVPAMNSEFKLRVAPPFGRELLKAIVALQPLKEFDGLGLARGDAVPVDDQAIRRALEELQQRPHGWAEHDVDMVTMARREPPAEPKRIGVFVGISEFKSATNLRVSHKDAIVMNALMKSKCKLDASYLLTNKEATLAAIEDIVRRKLPVASRPGDIVFFYWSGHGGRCPDNDGDEEDGYDEFLVPYDGSGLDSATLRRTMLMDDTFGRWMQELDGRRLVLILDTCCSGGQSANQKGIGEPVEQEFANGDQSFDFFGGEISRTKDIGQKETALLASSKPIESSFERFERDLSVMTYFIVRKLNEPGPISLRDVFKYVESEVPAYVRERVHGHTQTPVLVDHTSPPLYLKP